MDACFGSFIEDLKARGLFDRSIIIVTADHGDSLGEQGRLGHAYTTFPEIVQVPLIVHLPPAQPASFFGRPVFRRTDGRPPQSLVQPQLVASSYGSVYGTLLDDARRLYIFDGIALREYLYELDGTPAGRPLTVTNEDRLRGQRAIRDTVGEIGSFYGYRP